MAIDKETGLTDKQKRFCDEYLIDFNGTQAAIRAGYSKSTANEIASENLAKPNIQNYIKERKEMISKSLQITSEMLTAELAKIAFVDIRMFYDKDGKLLPISELSDQAAAALGSAETFEENAFIDGDKIHLGDTKKIKMWDKLKAIELLGRNLGYFDKDNKQTVIQYNTELTKDEIKEFSKYLNDKY